MFQKYLDQLRLWLESREVALLLDSLSDAKLRSQSYHSNFPDRKRLWKSYLLEAFPDPIKFLFSQNQIFFEEFINQLLELDRFVSKSRILRLLEHSVIASLNLSRLDKLADKLFAFNMELDSWISGGWHKLLNESSFDGFDELRRQIRFSSDWSCARFLSANGFFFPTGWNAYLSWLNYSGDHSQNKEYEGWLRLLNSVGESSKEVFRLDFWLESIFSLSSILDLPLLCDNFRSCQSCPLKSDCQLFRKTLDKDREREVENCIRIGNFGDVEDKDLLLYLAGDRYTASKNQKTLVESFPDIKGKLFDQCHSRDDESFLYFLRGVEYLAGRIELKRHFPGQPCFKRSVDIYKYFKPILFGEEQEHFYSLILDNQNYPLRRHMVTKGILNQSLVHPREVFAPAIQLRAAAIVLVHNHPSGDPNPSRQDLEITDRLVEAGRIIGINILDHLIIGRDGYYSFVDENKIPKR